MNKNNSNKLFLGCALSVLSIAALAGCGSNGLKKDPTKIYLEPFAGSGFGYEWIEDLAKEWKAQTTYDFTIEVDTSSVYMNIQRY